MIDIMVILDIRFNKLLTEDILLLLKLVGGVIFGVISG